MGIEAILEKLKNDPSIVDAFILDGEFYKDVLVEEGGITESSMGMPLVNRALEEVLRRDTSICLFCKMGFETPTDHVMIMEDTKGNIVGHDIPGCMFDDFKDNAEIFWLCDDFVVYPNKTLGDIVIVMLPQKVRIVGTTDGADDPVLLYPATTTDLMLKKHFDISPTAELASAILSFNLLE